MDDVLLEDTEYDVIILGTGLIECMLSAACARIGKKILHIDHQDYYGSTCGTYCYSKLIEALTSNGENHEANYNNELTQEELEQVKNENLDILPIYSSCPVLQNPVFYHSDVTKEIQVKRKVKKIKKEEQDQEEQDQEKPQEEIKEENSEQNNNKEDHEQEQPKIEEEEEIITQRITVDAKEELMKSNRRFNIDLNPVPFWAIGSGVDILVKSGVYRYLEFRCFDRSYLFSDDNEFKQVICSKSDIFKTKNISRVEKFKLMKFVKSCLNTEEPDKLIEEMKDKPFLDLLVAKKLTPKLQQIILYSIALLPTSQEGNENPVTVEEGLNKLKQYLRSVGKFNGQTPFIYTMYGMSELPQAFTRLSAVYLGIFVLRRTVKSLLVDRDSNEFKSLICSAGQRLSAPFFVTNSDYLNNKEKTNIVSRCICITDKPLIESEENTLFVVVPPNRKDNKNTASVYIQQLHSILQLAPNGKYLIHFTTSSNENSTAEEDLKTIVSEMINIGDDDDDNHNNNKNNNNNNNNEKPTALFTTFFNIGSCNLDKDNIPSNVIVCEDPNPINEFGYKNTVDMAENLFHKMFPEEEFLPSPPNPYENESWEDNADEVEDLANKKNETSDDTNLDETDKDNTDHDGSTPGDVIENKENNENQNEEKKEEEKKSEN